MLRPREASIELTSAAAKFRERYRKQQALQMLALKNFKVGEEVFGDCNMKYHIE